MENKPWKINDPKVIKIHKKIMTMIAMDNQPFSVTNDQGFIDLLATLEPRYLSPSTKYFTDTMLPHTYERLKIKVNTGLSEASFLSFTSDIWTNSTTITS